MTNKKRFLMALTVVSFLTVTGLVVGCDSDDGPKVTPPSGGGGATATRNTTAETQGREGLEATDNGTMIRNTGEVALNVRFAYDPPRHYRLNVNTAMPSDPASAGSAPARVACGVPATGRANGQCFNNDRSEIQSAPTPYEASGNGDNGNGDNGNGENGAGYYWNSSIKAPGCVQVVSRGRRIRTVGGNLKNEGTIRNTCGRPIIPRASYPGVMLTPGTVVGRGGGLAYNHSSGPSQVLYEDPLAGVAPGATSTFQENPQYSGQTMIWIACYSPSPRPNTNFPIFPNWTSSDPAGDWNCFTYRR